jgi:large subunit ribosomal protein L35
MPKMKTKSSAKKRFKITGAGKVRFKQAFSRHMQMNKPKKMKRKARGTDEMFDGDAKLVMRNFFPYERSSKFKSKGKLKKMAKFAEKKAAKAAAAKKAGA